MIDELLQATIEHDAAYIQAQERRIAELESERDHLRLAGLEVQSQRDRIEAERTIRLEREIDLCKQIDRLRQALEILKRTAATVSVEKAEALIAATPAPEASRDE